MYIFLRGAEFGNEKKKKTTMQPDESHSQKDSDQEIKFYPYSVWFLDLTSFIHSFHEYLLCAKEGI